MDPRNFTKIVLRKIREQFKDVWIQMVHNDMRSTGSITADNLRQVFYRLNVVSTCMNRCSQLRFPSADLSDCVLSLP
eukprot:COSAG02_NODE_506_length_20931_cov_20.533218_5_plen_77_part_00